MVVSTKQGSYIGFTLKCLLPSGVSGIVAKELYNYTQRQFAGHFIENERACLGTSNAAQTPPNDTKSRRIILVPGRADPHMHSTYSDTWQLSSKYFRKAQHFTNLDVIALTDHDVIEGL